MKLFGDSPSPRTEREPDDALRRRLDDLAERLDRHERIVKELRLEWDEMYDKFRLLMARLSKRIRDAAKLEDEPQDAPGRANGPRRMVGDLPEFPEPPGPRRNY